jgi:hypothetical protein
MRTYKNNGSAFRACNIHCADSFKEDRKHGLCYGLQLVRLDDDKVYTCKDREEFSVITDYCAYCGK